MLNMLLGGSANLAQLALQPYRYRTIYLRIKPAPLSLTERRSVLKALQQNGDIEVFKKLQDDSSFISITANVQTAKDLVEQSPLQYDFQQPPPARLKDPFLGGLADQRQQLSMALRRQPAPPEPKTFTIEIFPAPKYPHRTQVKRSPLHGPWPRPRMPMRSTANASFGAAALKQLVPNDMRAPALWNWDTWRGDEVANDVDALALLRREVRSAPRTHDRQALKMLHIKERLQRRMEKKMPTAEVATEVKRKKKEQVKAEISPSMDEEAKRELAAKRRAEKSRAKKPKNNKEVRVETTENTMDEAGPRARPAGETEAEVHQGYQDVRAEVKEDIIWEAELSARALKEMRAEALADADRDIARDAEHSARASEVTPPEAAANEVEVTVTRSEGKNSTTDAAKPKTEASEVSSHARQIS